MENDKHIQKIHDIIIEIFNYRLPNIPRSWNFFLRYHSIFNNVDQDRLQEYLTKFK